VAEPLLELHAVDAAYGHVRALRGVTLTVMPGELVCLLGGNGAGKTTTLLCASAVHHAVAGSVRFAGEDLTRLPAHAVVARGLVQVPEGRRIFPRLSVAENLAMGAWLRRDRAGIARDRERIYALFPVLAERRGQEGGTLSGGEQQMLALGRALMAAPRLLMLDEPSMGIAPLLVARIAEAIRALNRDGLPILLVEQNARLALGLASRAYVLETGAIAMHGTSAELAGDPRIAATYLGGA
jgi:branched-chain amino acid transport system ATP-binding protein